MINPITLSQRSHMTRDLAISYLMQQGIENPECLSLAAGFVDPITLPVDITRKLMDQILSNSESGRVALQYGTTQGNLELRCELLKHFAALENQSPETLGIDESRIVVTTGSQQLLSLVCETLFDPGDICLVAGPTYFVFAGNLEGVGVRAITIPADENGMQPELLDAALAQLAASGELSRVKLIYTVSYYDNPSGVCIATDRRKEIVEIAQKWSQRHRILILEDAAYRELQYGGETHPSIWSYDDSRESVIYTQTFSKTFAPGIRTGFGILPQQLVGPICDRKGNEDFGSANLNQHLIRTALQTGLYQEHLEVVRKGYLTKRDAMLTAAAQYFSELDDVHWVVPEGGLYVWMSLPEEISTGFNGPLFQQAIENKVMYVPGELCYCGPVDQRPQHQMRLSFGVLTPERIDEGMQRLAKSVEQTLALRAH